MQSLYAAIDSGRHDVALIAIALLMIATSRLNAMRSLL